MKDTDVDPSIRRYFPWALFLAAAILFAMGAYAMAFGSEAETPMPYPPCEEIVARVGLVKPLWLAEREARKKFPRLTDAQIAYGRKCIIEARRAVLGKVKEWF